MVLKKEYLVLLNSRNRVQQALLQLNQNPFSKDYTIERTNCQWGGKEIQQPTLTITYGKAGRTAAEQDGSATDHCTERGEGAERHEDPRGRHEQ